MSAILRAIDLTTAILAPVATGQIMGSTDKETLVVKNYSSSIWLAPLRFEDVNYLSFYLFYYILHDFDTLFG
jgi:hypothetical protein